MNDNDEILEINNALAILQKSGRICEIGRREYFVLIDRCEKLLRLTLALSPKRHRKRREENLGVVLAALADVVAAGYQPMYWPADLVATVESAPTVQPLN